MKNMNDRNIVRAILFSAAVSIAVNNHKDDDPSTWGTGVLEARIVDEAGDLVDHMIEAADIYDEDDETDEMCLGCGMKHKV